jgi:anti-anti-sigma factor
MLTSSTAPVVDASALCAVATADRSESRGMPLRAVVVHCPGPRFCGRAAARFVRFASPLCRAELRLVLDFGDVRVIDAAGVLAVAGLARACRAGGGTLSLCNAAAAVRALLASVGLHDHADILHTPAYTAV